MRLLRFEGTKVHGAMRFDITFHKDLTFLTGINGSGKTTVLNAIQALISPSLTFFAETAFESLRVDLDNDGVRTSILAQKDDTAVKISVPHLQLSFVFSAFRRGDEASPTREQDAEQEYYRELLNSDNKILRFIASLPTPMFLGLDRRARFADENDRRLRNSYGLRHTERISRNVFNASAYGSLSDASAMANTAYRNALISTGKIGEDLLRTMLLKLLDVDPVAEYGSDISMPSKAELREINTLKSYVDLLPQILNLPREEVRSRVLPFLNALEQVAKEIPQEKSVAEILGQSKGHEPDFNALLRWSANSPQLKRIRTISEIVAEYNKRRKKITEPTDNYAEIVNKFFTDSGKRFKFEDEGYACFEFEEAPGRKSLATLSSGGPNIRNPHSLGFQSCCATSKRFHNRRT